MMDLLEKYRAAERMLPWHAREMVINGSPEICWLDGETLAYQREVRADNGKKRVTVRVNAVTGAEEVREDEASGIEAVREAGAPRAEEVREAGASGTEAGRKAGAPKTEEVREAGASGAAEAVRGQGAGGTDWRQEAKTCASPSPDGGYRLFWRSHNLYLGQEGGGETQLTFDGEPMCEYGCYVDIYSQITVKRQGYREHPLALWSPDGRYFVTYRADRRAVKKLYVIESFGDSDREIRPRLREYPCPFAGDQDGELPRFQLCVGDVRRRKLTVVDAPPYVDPVFTSAEKSFARWLPDSSGFYFTWFNRGYREGRLYLADADTGRAVRIVGETADTFLNLGAFGQLDGFGSYQFSNYVTPDRKLAFWQSERSGYAHLYRYRLDTGACEGDLFGEEHREMIVQKLVKVDEGEGRIYFMANNVPGCSDPLYYQLFAVNFDGSGLTRLTPEDATHRISMGERAFADTYSRVDLPPVTVLRGVDGSLIRELERADVSELLAAGYRIPERFTVTAADGVTKLCGILVRPAGFSPREMYPLIDYIYGGAQLYNVPREFTWDNAMGREAMGGLQEFAQLGMAGIILDGRGTPGRGKRFHEFSWRGIHECAGLKDHASCLPELKAQFPFLDLDRVGIWGNSGGGYAAVSAMFQYPEIYRAGVASAGNYDQRMYENSWTERYYGLYDEELYRQGDITRLAGKLRGRLLLACGALDDNVSMSQTLRLCDRLICSNRDYELLVLPRANHNVPADPYFIRRKLDFFVRHLLGQEPPEYEFKVPGQGTAGSRANENAHTEVENEETV